MNNPKLGQVFTSTPVAQYMVSLFSIQKDEAIVEPCFGSGAFLEALSQSGYSNVTGYEIDRYWCEIAKQKYSDYYLFQEDFLQVSSSGEYSGVIMNPPYIRHERIDDLSDYGIKKDILFESRLFGFLPRTANLYMFFVLKALDLLKEEGELVVIFPSSWMSAVGGKGFKDYLYTNVDVVLQSDVYGEIFENAALVEVTILKIIKRKPISETIHKCFCVSGGKIQLENEMKEPAQIGFSTSFGQLASVRRGLTTGYNKLFINPDIHDEISLFLHPILSSPKDFAGYQTEGARTDNLLCVHGNQSLPPAIIEYFSRWKGLIMLSGTPKTLFTRILQQDDWYVIKPFSCEGIIFSYIIRNDIRFSLNTASVLVRDNFYVIYPHEGIDKYILLALLNNYYTFYQLDTIGKKYGAGLLKILLYDIQNLCFPDITAFSEKQLCQLKKLGKQLVEKGNTALIPIITRFLSDSIGRSYSEIENQYLIAKYNRLERV